jgi:hypothetical protein
MTRSPKKVGAFLAKHQQIGSGTVSFSQENMRVSMIWYPGMEKGSPIILDRVEYWVDDLGVNFHASSYRLEEYGLLSPWAKELRELFELYVL